MKSLNSLKWENKEILDPYKIYLEIELILK